MTAKNTLDTPLSDLQQRFVEEYIIDPTNQRAAALRAGYSPGGAAQIATTLLRDPRVTLLIEEETGKAVKKTGVTKERIILELSKIAFANIGDVLTFDPVTKRVIVDPDKLNNETTSALQELSVTTGSRGTTVKIKQSDKQTALIALGKHLGMFNEKLEISGSVSLQRLIEDSFRDEPLQLQSQPSEILDATYQEVVDTQEQDTTQLDLFK